MADSIYTVTKDEGHFGGGDNPQIPAEVFMLTVAIPEGCHLINGVLYRTNARPGRIGEHPLRGRLAADRLRFGSGGDCERHP